VNAAVSALVTDLMDRSKFPPGVSFVRRAVDLDGGADVVVVDLSQPGATDAVVSLRAAGSTATVVAYGSHVDRDALAAARAAGCDRVLARSAFFADVTAALS
jgi:DNA-binding NarL/FixJ family response regulator